MSMNHTDYPNGLGSPPERTSEEDILLYVPWSSSPGSSGKAALLVQRSKEATEVIHWDDDSGLLPQFTLPAEVPWQDLAAAVASRDFLGVDRKIRSSRLGIEGLDGLAAIVFDVA